MKITIAHPLAASELKSEIDATVEVDDDTAARLVADGFARPADKKSRSTSTPDAPAGADNEGA